MEITLPPLTCLLCRFTLSPQTPRERISSGDYAVCPECGMILIYKTDLTFRFPTEQDMQALEPEHAFEMQKLQARALGKKKGEFEQILQTRLNVHLSN